MKMHNAKPQRRKDAKIDTEHQARLKAAQSLCILASWRLCVMLFSIV
jgi:hypothetical protein